MYCLWKPVLNLQHVEEVHSPFLCVFFDRKRPMTATRWGPVAILLLGVAVLGSTGETNKEGYRLTPYRPVLRFRHKVLIAIFYHLHSIYKWDIVLYRPNYSDAFYLIVLVVFLPAEKHSWWFIIHPSAMSILLWSTAEHRWREINEVRMFTHRCSWMVERGTCCFMVIEPIELGRHHKQNPPP